jgi:hypothetical protein
MSFELTWNLGDDLGDGLFEESTLELLEVEVEARE